MTGLILWVILVRSCVTCDDWHKVYPPIWMYPQTEEECTKMAESLDKRHEGNAKCVKESQL
jgi:hypothetical protein